MLAAQLTSPLGKPASRTCFLGWPRLCAVVLDIQQAPAATPRNAHVLPVYCMSGKECDQILCGQCRLLDKHTVLPPLCQLLQ